MSEPRKRPKRARRQRRLLVWGALGLLAAFFLYQQFDPFARRTARVQLEAFLGDLLLGEVHIDRVAQLGFGGIVAEGVTVLDPDGRRVLRARELSLGLDLFALRRSTLHFTHGSLKDVTLTAHASESAAITLFDALTPKPSPPGSKPSSLRVLFDHIHVQNATFAGDVPGLRGIDARALEARGRILVDSELHVQVSEAHADVVGPYPRPLALQKTTFTLDTGPLRLETHFRVARGDDRVHGALTYRSPPGLDDALDLLLVLEPISNDLLTDLGFAAAQVLLPEVRGSARLTGPVRELAYRAALTSAAGNLNVWGRFPERGGVNLHFESAGLDLAQLIAYAPQVQLTLRVSAEARAGEPVALHIDAPKLDVLGIQMRDAHVSGAYQGERFHFDDARVAYAGGKFAISGWVDNDADFYVHVKTRLPELARDPFARRAGLSAQVVSDLQVARAGPELSFEGSLALSNFRYDAIEAERLVLEGSAEFSEDSDAPSLNLRGHAENARLGDYPLGALTFHGKGRRGRYASQVALRGDDGRTAALDLIYETGGGRQHFVAKRMTLALPGHEAWRAEADVTLTRDGVDIDRVELQSGAQHLRVSGRYSYTKAYRVDARLTAFDLGGLRELLLADLADLDGTLDGTFALSGVPNHPRIDVNAVLKQGRFLGMEPLGLKLNLVFLNGRFDLNTELVLPDKSRLSVYAGGEPGAGESWTTQIAHGNYQFGLDFDNVPFSVSKPWLAWINVEPPAGTISATVRGAGSFVDPEFSVESHIEDFGFGDVQGLDFDLQLKHDGTALDLERLRVADVHGALFESHGGMKATLAELLDLEALRKSLDTRPFDLHLQTPRRRLDELPAPLRVDLPLPVVAKLDLAQTDDGPALDVDALLGFPTQGSGISTCEGTLRRPELALQLSTAGGKARGTLELTLDGQHLGSAKLEADSPLTAWLTGNVPFALPRTRLALEASTLASEDIPLLCGVVAGPLKVQLDAQNLFADAVSAHFALHSPALQLVPHTAQRYRLGNLHNLNTLGMPFAIDLKGAWVDSNASFKGVLSDAQGSLQIAGELPSAALLSNAKPREGSQVLTLKLSARSLEIAPLTVALPYPVRSSGLLSGAVTLRYDFGSERVALSGGLELRSGTLGIAPLGQELADVTARLRFQGDTLNIETLKARDFDGKIAITGPVRFTDAEHLRLDLGLDFKEFPVRNEGAQVSRLTGKLGLRAEVDPQSTRAELTVKQLRVNLPSDLGTGLQDLDPHPSILVVGEERPKPPETPYVFELRVLAQKPPFRVLRPDLSADVYTDLTVRYANPELTLQGNAVLKHGAFELYGRRFELDEGRIAFDGADQLDPLVSLYATHKVGKDEIGVRVDGRLSDPKITFTHSNPAITDQGTIIAALLGVRNSDPSLQYRDPSGAAAGMLAGATAGLLTERVRREFGGAVPVISMDSSGTALRASRIRAGLQLDQLIEKRLGRLSRVVRGAYVEGFVAPGASSQNVSPNAPPQSRAGGLLELRFPADMVGTVEYRPVQNWRVDVAWEP